ncbi:MAG: HTTM domain-containing protein [Acidimicrobiia bacterium]|nr:HTTM domain-containing protein [Acidimicrobiia bacterium]
MRIDPVAMTIDARRLAATRILLGGSAVSVGLHAYRVLSELRDPDSLRLPFLTEIDLTGAIVVLLVGLWLVSAAAYTIGWKTNVAGRLLFGIMAVTVAVDQQLYSNHAYLLWLLVGLSTLSRPGAAWSLDSRTHHQVRVPAWPVVLMCTQVSLVYLFAAATKLNPDFLSGLMLERWLAPSAQWAVGASRAMSVITPIVESFLGLALWSPRLRRFAILGGVLFHLSTPIFMVGPLELIEFSAIMVSTYWLFPGLTPAEVTAPSQPSRPTDSASTVPG